MHFAGGYVKTVTLKDSMVISLKVIDNLPCYLAFQPKYIQRNKNKCPHKNLYARFMALFIMAKVEQQEIINIIK